MVQAVSNGPVTEVVSESAAKVADDVALSDTAQGPAELVAETPVKVTGATVKAKRLAAKKASKATLKKGKVVEGGEPLLN